MPIKFSNNANTTLASGITAAATSLSVAAGTGAKFPTLAAGDYFFATLVSAANPSNFEIVKVTARSTDTFTITRAQEGTAALAFVAGDTVQLRFTAQTFQDALNERIQQGGGTGQGTNKIYIGWLGTQLGLQVDTTNFGGSWPINISGSASQLVTTNGYTVAGLDAVTAGSSPSVDARTPNNGTTGGIRLRGNATTGNAYLQVTDSGATAQWGYATFTSAGGLTWSGDITAFSDERLKKNWRPVAENFVERLAGVKSGVYERTDMEITQVGVSAQSLREVMPEAVIDMDDTLSVNYGNAALASAVEIAKELMALRAEVEALRAELAAKG